jgi:hypothetical protein
LSNGIIATWQRKLVLHSTPPILFNIDQLKDSTQKYVAPLPKNHLFTSMIVSHVKPICLWNKISIHELVDGKLVDVVVPNSPAPYVRTFGDNTAEQLEAIND